MIYLYGVTATAPQGFRGLGLDREPVVCMTWAGLHLAHSFHRDGFAPEATPDALWAHEGVVDELLEAGGVVPFSFGTTLCDRAAAQAYLEREAKRFRRVLGELRGQVELAVRVALPEREPAASKDGVTYLATRSRERDTEEQLLRPLESLAVASTKRSSAQLIRASYLVTRDEVEHFSAVVADIQESNPGLALTCTGPWAPYSFVRDLR